MITSISLKKGSQRVKNKNKKPFAGSHYLRDKNISNVEVTEME